MSLDSPNIGGMTRTANDLVDDASFRSARDLGPDVPWSPGVYAIRLRMDSSLPEPFHEHLVNRATRLIYIGKAKSLKRRMLGNELRGRGHGTFFRSLGAVLGYRPQAGSLVALANKNNYRYERADRDSIIEWINTNLEVSWNTLSLVDVPATERTLIMNHTPLLNLARNPLALAELRALRLQSRQIAATE